MSLSSPDGAGLNLGPFSFSLAPRPPSHPHRRQWNLHRVPEWHAEHLAHRPELHPGGADRVFRTGQGATSCATLGRRTSGAQPVCLSLYFLISAVAGLGVGALREPIPFRRLPCPVVVGTRVSFQHHWFPSPGDRHHQPPAYLSQALGILSTFPPTTGPTVIPVDSACRVGLKSVHLCPSSRPSLGPHSPLPVCSPAVPRRTFQSTSALSTPR